MRDFENILAVYNGSDGNATQQLYYELQRRGPLGNIAMNLFRAQKASERAKLYRGGNAKGSYSKQAYQKKHWSLRQLAEDLAKHGEALGITWGWKEDSKQKFHKWVLYVDTPAGQISFHTEARNSVGPDYADAWDGTINTGPERICRLVADVFADEPPKVEA